MRQWMTTVAVAAVLTGALAPVSVRAQVAQTAQPITLDEAVNLAKRNAPEAIQARNTIRTSAGTVRQRYAAFLPSLSIGAGVGMSDGTNLVQRPDPGDPSKTIETVTPFSSPWRGSHNMNANLTLFQGGQRFFQLSQAQAQLDAAEAAEVAQNYTVALNVKQQYYAVLAAREQRSAAQRQLESAEQQLRASTARVQAGAASRSDSLRTSIQVGQAKLAILQAENSLNNANAALSRLVGSDVLVTAVAEDTTSDMGITLSDEELFSMLENSPSVRQAEANEKAAKQGARQSLGQYLPSLSMSYGQSYNGPNDQFQFWGDSRNKNNSTRFSISWQLFNNLQREQQVLQNSVSRDNAEANLRNARLQARQNLIQQLGAFRTAEVQVAINQASVAAGEEDLRVVRERYGLGASTLLEVLQSQTTLDQARRDLIQARLNVRTAKAQIEALIGRDL